MRSEKEVLMKKLFLCSALFIFLAGCGRLSDDRNIIENPNDVYGILAKAESGEKKVTCPQLQQGYKDANTLAAKKKASVPELSLPGRYLNVLKRYNCSIKK